MEIREARKIRKGDKVKFLLENLSQIENPEIREAVKGDLIKDGFKDGEYYNVVSKFRDGRAVVFYLDIEGKSIRAGSYLFSN